METTTHENIQMETTHGNNARKQLPQHMKTTHGKVQIYPGRRFGDTCRERYEMDWSGKTPTTTADVRREYYALR